MTREELEREFTSMLVQTDQYKAYGNLCSCYLRLDAECNPVALVDQEEKLITLRYSDPKEWITKIFTEGLDIPPLLYRINSVWLKHLEEIDYG